MILRELATRLGCELVGAGEVDIRGVAGIEEAGPGDLIIVIDAESPEAAAEAEAAAVDIVWEEWEEDVP